MPTELHEYFYGCHLPEGEGDRILGIKAELEEIHGEDAAVELYDGVSEGLRCLLGDGYVHEFTGELFVGSFLAGRDDFACRHTIKEHLAKACGETLATQLLAVWQLVYGEDGEVIDFRKEQAL